ncbi:hypothetical protein [Opitutus sp. ER46]|uniref:hypothetical protein n=1 Tax=Opitutus sp. ER46 TaxID=2161864 RepID=UPI000D2F9A2A|nr:hypothetical protein [Opitutus sp. ER46]PTX91410.1 hypothetical protein DB354_16065 [Opitutus sp. ER46]
MKRTSWAKLGTVLRALGWLALLASAPSGTVAAPAEAPLEMPPMIVSEGTTRKPWRYAAAPGIEILGRCDDSDLRDLIRRNHALTHLMRVILPDELQFHTSVPRMVVVVEASSAPTLARDFLERFGEVAEGGGARRPGDGAAARAEGKAGTQEPVAVPRDVRVFPNLMLQDLDAFMMFAMVEPGAFNAADYRFTEEHLRVMLTNRTPALPVWFVEGWLRMYRASRFGDDEIVLAPLAWLSASEVENLQADPDLPRRVMPLPAFFALRAEPTDAADAAAWRGQAELLVRWMLATPERRAAMGRFVSGAAAEGESEALVRTCFGVDYATLRDELSDSLLSQVVEFRRIPTERPPRLRGMVSHIATPAEIGRLKGEWERLETNYVRLRHPAYASKYLELARETIAKARESAPGDPGLLAVAGLLACDQGLPEEARPLLEAAAARQLCRPRVYAELAGLRLDEMGKGEAGEARRLSVAQAEIVVETLALAQKQQPPLALTYGTLAAAWARSDMPLTVADLAVLADGLRRFPRNLQLLYFGAILEARHQSIAQGLALAERGLATATTPAAQQRFRDLIAALKRSP